MKWEKDKLSDERMKYQVENNKLNRHLTYTLLRHIANMTKVST